jgi:four helix bundle protein
MITDLKLYKEAYDFLLYIYPEIKKYPKSDKYTLGEDIKKTTLSFLSYIIYFSKHKINCLKDADKELELLRIYIRLSFDLKIISFKKYEIMSKKINEMGNLLGGLIKQNK